jgi:hypothetical protein
MYMNTCFVSHVLFRHSNTIDWLFNTETGAWESILVRLILQTKK